MRRLLLLLLKVIISLLLLYVSLRTVNLAALGERLSRLNVGWIIAALSLQAAQVALQVQLDLYKFTVEHYHQKKLD